MSGVAHQNHVWCRTRPHEGASTRGREQSPRGRDRGAGSLNHILRFVHKRPRGLMPASGVADAKRCGTVWDHRIVPLAGSCIASSHPHGRTSDAVNRQPPTRCDDGGFWSDPGPVAGTPAREDASGRRQSFPGGQSPRPAGEPNCRRVGGGWVGRDHGRTPPGRKQLHRGRRGAAAPQHCRNAGRTVAEPERHSRRRQAARGTPRN
jgi:hypothetical protein